MAFTTASLFLLAGQAVAFPWVANMPGVDSSMLRARSVQQRQADVCPNNPTHEGAVPYNPKFPYCGAQGTRTKATFPCNNNRVPAPGDEAHRYIAPGPLDIRGPCPGINVAANHGFLSRDGITTYDELVEMQQNVYGVGWDLANLLATAGVVLDGDVVTGKVSIGCDATSRTASLPLMKSGQAGLNGHNKFEADTSLTRNDYYLGNGDDYTFNRTLYDDMIQNYCKGNCNRAALALYRSDRWETSKATNPNFYFGPGSLLLYGAASFLYALFPSGGSGIADKATMDAFFVDEKLPEGWTSRSAEYSMFNVGGQILSMYNAYPKPFGANRGQTNSYFGLGKDGLDFEKNMGTPDGIRCALYSLATQALPATLLQNPIGAVEKAWAYSKLKPIIDADAALNPGLLSGCPIGPHSPDNPA